MYKTKPMNLNISAGLMLVQLFPAAMFLSANLFVLAHNVLIESALKKSA